MIAAFASATGFYFISRTASSDSQLGDVHLLEHSVHRESFRMTSAERSDLTTRLRSEIKKQQNALEAGLLSASDYQDWLYDWTEENQDYLPLPQETSSLRQSPTLKDFGVVHHLVAPALSPEQLAAQEQIQALQDERQQAIASFAHLASTDPQAYQDALHDWQEEHGKALAAKQQEIIAQSGLSGLVVSESVELPPNSSEEMIRYKELHDDRATFFKELEKALKNEEITAEEWQETLQENEKDLKAIKQEIENLKKQIASN